MNVKKAIPNRELCQLSQNNFEKAVNEVLRNHEYRNPVQPKCASPFVKSIFIEKRLCE